MKQILCVLLAIVAALSLCACSVDEFDIEKISPEAVGIIDTIVSSAHEKVAYEAKVIEAKAKAAIENSRAKKQEYIDKIREYQAKVDSCKKTIDEYQAKFAALKEKFNDSQWKELYSYYTQQYKKAILGE